MTMPSEGAPLGPWELAQQLCDALAEYPGEAASVRRVLEERLGGYGSSDPAPVAVPVLEVEGEFPRRVLGAVGETGMVVAEGYVCVLAAEGGIGKSSLVGTVALDMAMGGGGASGIFDGVQGRVLIVTYEDEAVVTRVRLEELANSIDQRLGAQEAAARAALADIYVMDMEGWPLYGPAEFASYASRPTELRGWPVLWGEVERVQPSLVIIDPVLKAYVGESMGVSPVREFLGRMRQTARRLPAVKPGVMLTAHSTKSARGSRGASRQVDAFDPGHVSGSAAWIDEPRGVLTMTWGEDGSRNLAVVKANLGPSRIMLRLDPVMRGDGMVVGFRGVGAWTRPESVEADGHRNGNGNSVAQNGLLGRGGFGYDGIAR